ncbi:hypothetical protein [Sinomonas notoginsengisoli]|uniref:hypothetical protein n=1 Tax=Sinomonas notoginsengisoli TaxID=1457311 RepID=UPI001F3FC562|nr:hypothetical protein [Sinomonas notoginsengisoli]
MSESENAGAHPVPDASRHGGRERPLRPEGQFTDGEYDVEPAGQGEAVAGGSREGGEPAYGPAVGAPIRQPGQYTDGDFDTGADAGTQE